MSKLHDVEEPRMKGSCMAQVRYAVSGCPVTHSLSPLLMGLVLSNLEKFGSSMKLGCTVSSLHLVETEAIEDALGWGYAGHVPNAPAWQYTDAPFGKYRTDALMKKAIEAAMLIEDADPRFASKTPDDSLLSLSKEDALLMSASHAHLPSQSLENEVWMNLTSPLKHQLSSDAISTIDESMLLQSVNALRWDGRAWWCAGVDGNGVVALALHHGIDVTNGAILGIVGGGGAARSTADAWLKAGGKIATIAGRRTLELPYAFESEDPSDTVDFAVDFDGDLTTQNPFKSCLKRLNPSYCALNVDLDSRFEALLSQPFDGRWMLTAQHIEAWKRLWAPHYAHLVPSLDLLLTQLVHAESVLAAYT